MLVYVAMLDYNMQYVYRYVSIYIYIYTCICIYIYIYDTRPERASPGRATEQKDTCPASSNIYIYIYIYI